MGTIELAESLFWFRTFDREHERARERRTGLSP